MKKNTFVTAPCKKALFELYFQRNPRGGGFTVFSGTGAVMDLLAQSGLKAEIRAVAQGTPVFPGEPVLLLEGDPIELHEIASRIEQLVREQCEKATVTARLQLAAGSSRVNIGTKAPSCAFVQCFKNEAEAFNFSCEQNPKSCVLAVDSYSTLKSGIPNAISAFKLHSHEQRAVKISTGDIAYQAIHARKLLDSAGLSDCEIHAGGALDEFLIRDIKRQGAPVDVFCVERIAACNEFDMRFAVSEADGEIRMTHSQNVAKITPPGRKQIWRVLDEEGKALADLLTLENEKLPFGQSYTLFDPHHPWKKRTVEKLKAVPLLSETPLEPRARFSIGTLWDEVRRFENPHRYYVDYSQPLWEQFQKMMAEAQA